ncbi:isoaspartyl peptidase/L-asparaginase family protein [Ktedonospora formicarum]|uniref:Asparaginase n=1 Tax=Ktedonospora formicarum TaxID=2778364 RepID=A0A8J3IBL1_9CHLR|nr:isoaspartyl peptidase/L-asparaginase family protein [Ktedonospora formicarum]GHO48369.1 asparaginase [Ktedonospora formicarum]
MPIAIIVHGGAGTIAPEIIEGARKGCKEASAIGWKVLQSGGTALAAVEAAVRSLEDNPLYDAGTGSYLSLDGKIEMDAGMMEGHTLQVGSIAGVELIKNPISLARQVLESPHVLLVGKGARQFAQERGISLCELEDLLTEFQHQRWKEAHKALNEGKLLEGEKHGTVGAVAIDSQGHLAAATSTGGIFNKYPGRVGDSPLVGCGYYADEIAAASCTGDGEDFIRLLIAKRASDFVADGMNAQEAAEAAIKVLGARASGTGGLITVDRRGNIGFAYSTQQMSRAYMLDGMQEPIAAS